jgi:transposase
MPAAPWIISDELWELVEPLLPKKERSSRYPGCKRLPDCPLLSGILFPAHRNRLATPVEGTMLRLWGDLLASTR